MDAPIGFPPICWQIFGHEKATNWVRKGFCYFSSFFEQFQIQFQFVAFHPISCQYKIVGIFLCSWNLQQISSGILTRSYQFSRWIDLLNKFNLRYRIFFTKSAKNCIITVFKKTKMHVNPKSAAGTAKAFLLLLIKFVYKQKRYFLRQPSVPCRSLPSSRSLQFCASYRSQFT